MPTAHLIHGYLGAGKTTFARRLEMELLAIRFSHDEWSSRLYGDDPPVELSAAYHRNVWVLREETWMRRLALGLDVVLIWVSGVGRTEMLRAQSSLPSALTASFTSSSALIRGMATHRRPQQQLEGFASDQRSTFDCLKDSYEPLGEDESRLTMST